MWIRINPPARAAIQDCGGSLALRETLARIGRDAGLQVLLGICPEFDETTQPPDTCDMNTHTANTANISGLPDEAWLRSETVAALCGGVTRRTIYRWIEQGIFPKPHKHGGISVWNCGAVRAYLAKART